MSFKRILLPPEYATGEKLTSDLVGIGFRLTASPSIEEPNIEDSLVAASIEGIVREDFRVLALLVDWISIHLDRVNVDRLAKLVSSLSYTPVKAFWAGIAHWQCVDPRMKKLHKVYSKKRVSLNPESGDFIIQRNGEDDRFSGGPFRVPAKSLRHRPSDILSPKDLARKHSAYYWRTLMGASYRADIWAKLNRNSEQTPAQLARLCYVSFPTAWQAKKDWQVLHG